MGVWLDFGHLWSNGNLISARSEWVLYRFGCLADTGMV